MQGSAVGPDSEIARLDSLAVIVAGSRCSFCEQIRDFAIKRVGEIRRDVLVCELFFDRRIDDEIRHASLLPPIRTSTDQTDLSADSAISIKNLPSFHQLYRWESDSGPTSPSGDLILNMHQGKIHKQCLIMSITTRPVAWWSIS
jgi:hypothetical protein